MKKILALALLICLAFTLVACKGETPEEPTEKDYKLVVVTDDGLGSISKNKVTSISLALVIDGDGKIVAARFDSFEASLAVDEDGELATANRITTKVEQGDSYAANRPMPAGSWEAQSTAFANFIVGKTASDVAALDTSAESVKGDTPLVAGCTMTSSTPIFQQLVAKAFAYERKVSFKATGDIKLGLDVEAKFTGDVEEGAKVSAVLAGVVLAGGKVVASMLDEFECSYEFALEDDEYTAAVKLEYGQGYKGSKNEQGDNYDAYDPMASGRWYAQAQYFANSANGKTVAELDNLSTDKVEGSCTVYTGNYKVAIVAAAKNAK